MSQWKNIGAVVALSLTAALAGTGCMAQSADDDVTDAEMAAVNQDDGAVADENTGEADQAQCGFGLGGLGLGCGFNPWFGGLGFGGCWPGFGGCGFGGFGGCGFGGFGGCGFGGFGGCGFGGFGGCGGFAGCGLGLSGLGCGFAGPCGWGGLGCW